MALKLTLDSYVLVPFEMKEKSKIKEFKNCMHNMNKKMLLKGQGHLSRSHSNGSIFVLPSGGLNSLKLRSEIQWRRWYNWG